ncbi:MAG: hypothetical protein ACRDV4_00490 [Acidimicrobiales bacterium]
MKEPCERGSRAGLRRVRGTSDSVALEAPIIQTTKAIARHEVIEASVIRPATGLALSPQSGWRLSRPLVKHS